MQPHLQGAGSGFPEAEHTSLPVVHPEEGDLAFLERRRGFQSDDIAVEIHGGLETRNRQMGLVEPEHTWHRGIFCKHFAARFLWSITGG